MIIDYRRHIFTHILEKSATRKTTIIIMQYINDLVFIFSNIEKIL